MKSQNWILIDENKDYGNSENYTFCLSMSKQTHQEILYDLLKHKVGYIKSIPFPPLYELRLDCFSQRLLPHNWFGIKSLRLSMSQIDNFSSAIDTIKKLLLNISKELKILEATINSNWMNILMMLCWKLEKVEFMNCKIITEDIYIFKSLFQSNLGKISFFECSSNDEKWLHKFFIAVNDTMIAKTLHTIEINYCNFLKSDVIEAIAWPDNKARLIFNN